MTLVRKQVNEAIARRGRKPRALLLAGGLGSNKYLHRWLKESFSDIEILRRPSQEPWHAICRGAVHRARAIRIKEAAERDSEAQQMNDDPLVVSRVERQSYGINYQTPYRPDVHLESAQIWHEATDSWRVAVMQWYLEQVSSILLSYEITTYS
jgi:hypothetical protein